MGCAAVGPDYTPIRPDAPDRWHSPLKSGLSMKAPDQKMLDSWWTILDDPILIRLEEQAVKGNLDLKDALARVKEARATRGIEKADLYPHLDVDGSVARQREIKDTQYSFGLDSSWEIDIFGGIRRSVEAAQAELEAAQAELQDILVTLTADVALNYMDVRTYQARLAAVYSNIKAQEEIYQLNRSRYEAGLIDELAVQQSLYTLEQTRSQIPVLQRGCDAAMNRIAVLLGLQPGSIHRELKELRPVPSPPWSVAIGIPADALRRRPDVRKAERELAAATARIGEAKAELYPKFDLLGTIGLEAVGSKDLWDWASRTWKIDQGITWKIFHAGAIRQNIKVQTARQEQALIQYQDTVLNALEEVENAIVAYTKEFRRMDSLKKAVKAAGTALDLAKSKYRAGLVDFSDVMDAERSLQGLQDELASSQGESMSDLIRLYKALGGGWVCSKDLVH